jgi:hypothetical protein
MEPSQLYAHRSRLPPVLAGDRNGGLDPCAKAVSEFSRFVRISNDGDRLVRSSFVGESGILPCFTTKRRKSVRIVEVPKGKDVSEWLASGGTIEELRELLAGQLAFTPEALKAWRMHWEQTGAEPAPSSKPAGPGPDSHFCRLDDAPEIYSDPDPPTHTNWPEELQTEAFYGVAGELVHTIEPHSEADPAALLVQFLVGFGNVIGRQPHFMAEADRHFMNLFSVIVGQTAKGRKGTSLGQIQRILATVDPGWSDIRMMGGLASGEGLIWAVRDEIRESAPVREKGRIVRYEEIVSDEGEKDKRLLVTEPEFSRVLQVAERESNTLSAVIRQAWDTGNLRILTKKQAARSTEAHISIIGHITRDELRRLLTDTAAGNGFANRFLWVCTRRSKVLPEGGALYTVDFAPINRRVQAAVEFARGVGAMQRDDQVERSGIESTRVSAKASRACSVPSLRGPKLRRCGLRACMPY